MDFDPLDAALTQLTADQQFSGVVRIDGPDGMLFERALGLASYTWDVPASMATRFDTASITKWFTAVAVLQQIEAGSFDLDTSAIGYLGLNDTAISPAVTARHLLTHSSGIADDADEEAGERYEDLWVDVPNYSVTETEHHLAKFVHKPANFAPGESVRYCNCSYVLLGLMIERATGESYRSYVTDHVFRRAGMDTAGFFRMDVVESNVAEGVEPIRGLDGHITGWQRNIYSYPPVGSPDGGAYVTAADLIAFHQALVGGRLLGPELTTAAFTPYVPRPTWLGGTVTMGFAVEFIRSADGTTRSYGKEGCNLGASGMLRHYPGPELTVAVLSNLEDGAWEPLRLIDDLMLAAR